MNTDVQSTDKSKAWPTPWAARVMTVADNSLDLRRRWSRLLLVIGVCAMSTTALAENLPVSVHMTRESGRQAVDQEAWLLEDRAGTMDLAAVRSSGGDLWKKPDALPINQGFSKSTWWARILLHNGGTGSTLKRIFEVGTPLQDQVDIFVVHGDGSIGSYPGLGDRAQFYNRPIKSVNPSVPLEVAPGDTLQVYVRFASHDGFNEQLPLAIWTPAEFEGATHLHWLISGLYYGLLLTIFVYTIFIYVGLRERIFAFYAAYVASCLLWRLTFSGDAFSMLWPSSPVLNNQILPVAIGCWFFFGTLYFCLYIELQKEAKKLHRGAMLLSGLSLASTLPAMFGYYAICFLLLLPLGLVQCAYLHFCNIVMARRGRRQGWWAMIAFLPLILSAFAYLLQTMALVPQTIWIAKSLDFAVAAQLLLLGFGLTDALDQMRKGKASAERDARLAQEDRARSLEEEVARRVSELASAKEQFRLLSITDDLTGVFNRRHFNEVIEAEVDHLRDTGRLPVLCLFDIDFFKSYNDAYGHQRGDVVLKAVAHALYGKLRDDERIFRVGGEEFAVLFPPMGSDALLARVENFRQTIVDLDLAHRDNPVGVVTASFGLALHPSAVALGQVLATTAALYREADRLLYLAKSAGRNCVRHSHRSASFWSSTDFGVLES